MPQEASAPRKALAAPSKASKPAQVKPDPKGDRLQVRGICVGVDPKTAKSGKEYWRVGLEANGVEWFTSFSAVDPDIIGKLIAIQLKPWQDGFLIVDVQVVVEEEVPF
jgi:hypothetical protein